MEQNTELKEALDFIAPASLTYDEWTMVGMGLKEAGYPVEAWEQWSARDGSRYHKGECVRKWESFHGSPTGTTTSRSACTRRQTVYWWIPAGSKNRS